MIGLTTDAEYSILIAEVERNEYTVTLVEENIGGDGGGLTSVTSDSTLTGNGTPESPLGVAAIIIRAEAALFTLSATDANKYIRYAGASAITVVVPNSLIEAKPVTIWQAGAGQITLVGDTGVVLNGDPKTAAQNKAIQILKVGDNLFDVIGGVA